MYYLTIRIIGLRNDKEGRRYTKTKENVQLKVLMKNEYLETELTHVVERELTLKSVQSPLRDAHIYGR
jgi:hypothetical protein